MQPVRVYQRGIRLHAENKLNSEYCCSPRTHNNVNSDNTGQNDFRMRHPRFRLTFHTPSKKLQRNTPRGSDL